MLKLKRVVVVIVLFVIYSSTKSQQPLYKRYFTESAGVTGAIYDVFQDKKGFIWLGTENGLVRFDGYKTHFYPPNKAFSKSVTNLFQDEFGVVYCQNFSGQFFKINLITDSLSFISQLSNAGNIKQANIINDSLVGFVDKKAIGFYNWRQNSSLFIPLMFNEIQPSTFKEVTNGYSLILPDNQQLVTVYPNKKKRIKSFQSKNVVFFHIKFNNNDLILGKRPPYVLENVDSKKTIPLYQIGESTIINQLVKIDQNHFALLTSDGVFIYNQNFQLIRHYFEKESISCFMKDQQENYWFGTLNNGLLLVSQPQTKVFLNSNNFTAIAQHDAKIYLGSTNNELYEFDSNTEASKLIHKDSTIHQIRTIYYNKHLKELVFSNQQLNFFRGHSLKKVVSSVSHITEFNPNVYLLSEGSSVSLFPVKTNDNVYKWFNSQNRVYANLRLALTKQNIRVKVSEVLGMDNIVSSTSNGLWLFTKSKQLELTYKNEKIRALSLCKLNSDSLLIATAQDGILVYTNGVINEFISPKKFAFNNVFMAKLFNRVLYVVTYNSFEVFDLNGKKILDQFVSDGYFGSDLVDFLVKDNNIYIANVNGLIVSPLTNFKPNTAAPRVYFTSTSINGKAVNFSDKIELNYNSYYFDFLFSIIDFKGLESTKAYYRLNEGEWIKTTENRILLTALEPNEYKIELKVVNERGVESTNIEQLFFSIKPPFYQTWWFILLSTSFLIFGLWMFFKFRIDNIKKQNQLLTEKIELENALQKSTLVGIKAQMNPHFIFNALNTIQSYIYLNDKKAAGDYLVSFSELTRYILEMSNKDKISLTDEIKALELYLKLEKMRFEDDFNYQIHYHEVKSDSLMIPSMLVQPYVENAVKHGLLHKKGIKTVKVEFKESENFLTVLVIDNGIGVEASSRINAKRGSTHQSFASDANKKRIEILNSNTRNNIGIETLELKNEAGQVIGTKVIINIPFIL